MGAVMGLNYGWEHPLWFSDSPDAADTNGFTRQNWWGPVGAECQMLRDKAGITDASNADATGGEPVFKDGQGVGRVTSGAYGYSVGMSLALGYVKGVGPGDMVEVMVLGRGHKTRILAEPPFDPQGERLRA